MSEMQPDKPSHRPIQSYIFGALLVLLFLAVCRLLAPFFTALLWSTLLYIMINPLHRRLIRNINFDTLKGKILRNLWAGVFTIGTLVIIFIPFSLVVSLFLRQLVEMGHNILNFLNKRPEYLHELVERIAELIRDISAGQINITADNIIFQVKTAIANEMQRMVFLSSNIVRNIGILSINLLIMMFSTFFFYADGPYLARLVLRAIPIKNEYISTLTRKFVDITRNLFFGYVLVSLLQAVVSYIIYTIFGVKGALVFSVITFLLLFVPVIGATIIYIPLSIVKIINGDIVSGVVFFIVSMVFISGIDNILRPIFLKDRIQLHPLIIFFAILGGLAVFGFNGFILGPMLVILFLTVLDMFLLEHEIGHQE